MSKFQNNQNLPDVLSFSIKVSSPNDTSPKYRNWGFAKSQTWPSFNTPDVCQICRQNFLPDNTYEVNCWCGNDYIRTDALLLLGLSHHIDMASSAVMFFACSSCVSKMDRTLQTMPPTMLNHEMLMKMVIELRKSISEEENK